MSSILLTDDSWCELSSEAQGRDLTPVSFGQIPADMPMDVSAFLLRALGAERRAGWSKQWPMTLVRWESSYLRKLGKGEGSDGLVQHGSLNLLLHAALHTHVRLELCTLLPPAMEGALRFCQILSSLSEIRVQDLPLRASRWTLQMPNCNPISLQLVAGLFSGACVFTLTATLPLYLCTAAALSALISVAFSRCSSNSSDK